MHESMLNMLKDRRANILHILNSYSFNKPFDHLRQVSQRIDELHRGMSLSMTHSFAMVKARSESLQQRITALDPQLVLQRGYTIVYKDEQIVDSSILLKSTDAIRIKFKDGIVRSTVS